jgi:hypothetical protein
MYLNQLRAVRSQNMYRHLNSAQMISINRRGKDCVVTDLGTRLTRLSFTRLVLVSSLVRGVLRKCAPPPFPTLVPTPTRNRGQGSSFFCDLGSTAPLSKVPGGSGWPRGNTGCRRVGQLGFPWLRESFWEAPVIPSIGMDGFRRGLHIGRDFEPEDWFRVRLTYNCCLILITTIVSHLGSAERYPTYHTWFRHVAEHKLSEFLHVVLFESHGRLTELVQVFSVYAGPPVESQEGDRVIPRK